MSLTEGMLLEDRNWIVGDDIEVLLRQVEERTTEAKAIRLPGLVRALMSVNKPCSSPLMWEGQWRRPPQTFFGIVAVIFGGGASSKADKKSSS